MAVDSSFYYDVYGGSEYADIDRLLLRAENDIECLIVTDPVTSKEEKYFKLAVCAQAEYMGLCGGVEAWQASSSGNASSVTVGSFSFSQGGSSEKSSKSGISPSVFSLLEKGGLLYRGCAVW